MRRSRCRGWWSEPASTLVSLGLREAAARVADMASRLRISVLIVAAASLVMASAGDVAAQMSGLNPTAAEISLLPKFCWEQMGAPNAKGDAYRPTQCGPGTNHYCPGLVWLLRARLERDSRKKGRMLDTAANDVQYTEQWISGYSNCSIRSHVKATKAEIEMLKTLYPLTPSVKK